LPSSGSPTPKAKASRPNVRTKHAASRKAAPANRRERGGLKSDRIEFAHSSERQYARLLDFYQVDWAYEPTTFDIEWDGDGTVVKRFSPDFYLPQFDLYIEVTTMSQKLVTKKNRKVRRLRELYPDVKIKIFYQRDYVKLLEKYGLARPEDEDGAKK